MTKHTLQCHATTFAFLMCAIVLHMSIQGAKFTLRYHPPGSEQHFLLMPYSIPASSEPFHSESKICLRYEELEEEKVVMTHVLLTKYIMYY